ncbi:haloacid dehalogenase type II [Paraburkholderia caballeronis]|uniref:2-haloacid dehalogenase n=1 Tax=Paraburkholderia caballeronis TaxID=416943 RepID=A0A1H7SZ17_9BURK|nr:haloacid dehalogenase type II [Paraburkholderia caballeronis]PXW25750.1 2-haloacid dehalogenase [Paraburkholderia caballeronis]PXX01357.1 2-haloacid dehalogenase [Paraburkholderia caballeronis]RAJ99289.1 2-haloacid dehalogenase [Paraburkholderia caballeronis]SEE24037.1 2-haloacid dehalogenase [Paraburkholderia caballeronis]SEL77831.1 2-haloacid dehalogenase [Paraburkholderia caballeronis]
MSLQNTARPLWLTFDCYGTLIQWDEGLQAAARQILEAKPGHTVDPQKLIGVYDHHEHALEQTPPHRSFREVAGAGLRLALEELGLQSDSSDAEVLTGRISAMPPFPEVVNTLQQLKAGGYRLCIVSNTDDDIIAGNVAQLGGHIDRVITAQQAGAYKPARRLFDYAHEQLGVTRDEVVHICASPHLDHAAARDIGFRCVWIDRGTGRALLPDYTPDATLATLDQVPALFTTLGW